jgi:hypothetical protein
MLQESLAYKIIRNLADSGDEKRVKADMLDAYEKKIRKIESRAHHKIRSLYKHNIFNYDLPPSSILHEDLFSESTWKLLGLSRKQQIAAAGISGAGIAVAIDAATAGTSFGLFAALGGLAGATWAALGSKGMAQTRILGIPLGGREIQIGPVKNIQFLYILLDRSLIYYGHISNWAHGRRDYDAGTLGQKKDPVQSGYAVQWDSAVRSICNAFFREATRSNGTDNPNAEQQMKDFLINQLQKISHSEHVKML